MEENKKFRGISAFGLHILAMGLMLCDHLWATVIPGNQWLTWLGRLAFPIFAFLIAEGYRHTRDVKKYIRRMLFCAILSEIPFNLMYGASWIYPFQQNVLWTFVIALKCMQSMDKIREKRKNWVGYVLAALAAAGWILLATVTFVDYSGWGVMMVLVFYLFRQQTWWAKLGQLGAMVYINWELIRGLNVILTIAGLTLEVPLQGAAVLALIPIWCYRGRQGLHSKPIRYAFYAFYPVHMLLLGLLSL